MRAGIDRSNSREASNSASLSRAPWSSEPQPDSGRRTDRQSRYHQWRSCHGPAHPRRPAAGVTVIMVTHSLIHAGGSQRTINLARWAGGQRNPAGGLTEDPEPCSATISPRRFATWRATGSMPRSTSSARRWPSPRLILIAQFVRNELGFDRWLPGWQVYKITDGFTFGRAKPSGHRQRLHPGRHRRQTETWCFRALSPPRADGGPSHHPVRHRR